MSDTLNQTANGYLLCSRHAEAWRQGGNTVAMWTVTRDDVDDEIPFACVDCDDETYVDPTPRSPAQRQQRADYVKFLRLRLTTDEDDAMTDPELDAMVRRLETGEEES